MAVAGLWQDAYLCLREHKGIGRRMLDGRQVAVIARLVTDEPAALTLLADTYPGEPWELAVTACLSAMCRGSVEDEDLAAFMAYHRHTARAAGLVVFRTRLGLSLVDGRAGLGHPTARASRRT